ncbi:hypothetical protein V5F29_05015 [Xanthobacter aminoxidans]|uniref:hypothetical protein n=1 Tax=Xanthobacter aminoxidans TaxID=186280 RepID=UPI00372C1DA0
MSIFGVNGSKFYIGTALEPSNGSDFDADDFTSQVWTEITPVESLGALGDTNEVATFNAIGLGRTLKRKGVANAGSMEVVMGADYADAGQLALRAAAKAKGSYAFKLEFNDKPAAGASPKNSTRMFTALVMSASEQLDDANGVLKLNSTLEINSNVVVTHASAT